jgi:hypothetical protein
MVMSVSLASNDARRANDSPFSIGYPSGGPWRQFHCLGCNGYFPEHRGSPLQLEVTLFDIGLRPEGDLQDHGFPPRVVHAIDNFSRVSLLGLVIRLRHAPFVKGTRSPSRWSRGPRDGVVAVRRAMPGVARLTAPCRSRRPARRRRRASSRRWRRSPSG